MYLPTSVPSKRTSPLSYKKGVFSHSPLIPEERWGAWGAHTLLFVHLYSGTVAALETLQNCSSCPPQTLHVALATPMYSWVLVKNQLPQRVVWMYQKK